VYTAYPFVSSELSLLFLCSSGCALTPFSLLYKQTGLNGNNMATLREWIDWTEGPFIMRWVIHPCICLPLDIFLAHVDCALSSCPELNQKYCYTWWLHSQPDSWTRLMIEQDGANVRPESSCLLICEDSHSRYQWHCDLTTAQIMRELAQPSRMGRYYNADMFFPLLSLPSLIS